MFERIWCIKALSILNVPHQKDRPCPVGSPDDNLIIKVQVSTISRWDMGYLYVVSDNIGHQSPPQTYNELEVQHYVLHSFCPNVLINFGCLSIIGLLLFQLQLMLVLNRVSVNRTWIFSQGGSNNRLELMERFEQIIHMLKQVNKQESQFKHISNNWKQCSGVCMSIIKGVRGDQLFIYSKC